MDETASTTEGTATVEWRRIESDAVAAPVVRRVPYLELKLEHPDLEPTGRSERFFPDAIPYRLDGEQRVFYWRPALGPSTPDATNWDLACATPRELVGVDELSSPAPELTVRDGTGVTVVVDGTVGGDATTARLRSYDAPTVRLDGVADTAVELTVDGAAYVVAAGERRRITLDEREVEMVDGDGGDATSVTLELVVRYPGRRTVHHPNPGSATRVFPSFGLDLDALPNPLPVPTAAEELDDEALAKSLGADLSERPYAERALWQAFAYTAFDPHEKETPALTQLASGHIVLQAEGETPG